MLPPSTSLQRTQAFADDPLLHTVRVMDPETLFLYYIRERYLVRSQRMVHKPQGDWTKDPILRTYKFTNVRRAWDYTTEWLTRSWYTPNGQRPLAGVACAVARFFCYVPTLQLLGFPTDSTNSTRPVLQRALLRKYIARSRKVLQREVNAHRKIFTSAYVIGGVQRGHAKHDWVLDEYIQAAYDTGALSTKYATCDEAHTRLVQLNGWGHFMTQEVVLDLTRTWVLEGASDIGTYGYAGPGAIRGLNRIHSRPVTASLPQHAAQAEMRALHRHLTQRKGLALPLPLRGTLTVHDVEFNLCEYDKYCRVLFGQGTPKQHFAGPAVDKWAALEAGTRNADVGYVPS